MDYFLLRHQYAKPSYIDATVVFSPPQPYYRIGTDLQEENLSISLKMDKLMRKVNVDFFYTTGGGFFASTELARLIQEHQKHIRVIPATSTYNNGKPTEKSYCLIHAPKRVNCFDYELSDYGGKALTLQRVERGEPRNLVKVIRKLVIDPKKANQNHFFFIDNVLLIDPVVSGDLARRITEKGFLVNLEKLANDVIE